METDEGGNRLLLAAALAAALLCAFAGQHDRQIWAPDEAREAGITAAMARTGDWVVPRLNGRPFLEKPPLFHAAGAAVMEATGSRSPFAVRLPAALFALATLAATFALGRRIGGTRLGALAVMVLATTGGFHAAAHRAVTDNAIPPFVTLAFLGLALLLSGAPRGPAFALAGAAAGVAFLAKGAIGPAFVVAGWAAALASVRGLRRLLDPMAIPALLLMLLPASAWLLALHGVEGPGALRTVLVDNNWDRASDSGADHASGPLYYLVKGPVALLPWLPLVLLGARRAWREGGLQRIPAAWLGSGLVLLSLATAKRPIYLLPLLPAAALLAAREAEAIVFEAGDSRYGRALRAAMGVAAAAGLAVAAGMDGLLRREDLAPAVAGLLLAGAGAAALRGGGRVRGAALAFGMAAAAFAFGFRALGPAGDAERGMDGLAAAVEERSAGRRVVLFRPTEAVEGILSLRMDRPIPVARTPEALAEERRLAGREVLLVGFADDPRWEEVASGASSTFTVETGRRTLVLAVLERPPAPRKGASLR
jgi:4-amino-4-deoxy-L-arabinose transferase-like glycosyltransferase